MTEFFAGKLSDRGVSTTLSEQVVTYLSLLVVVLWVFPQSAAAQSFPAPNQPKLAFEIKFENLISPSSSTSATRDIPGSPVNVLRSYLLRKNSPLADHVETLLLQPNWEIILSISHAESNMCKRHLGNNCWGIGGAKYHRFYPTFAQGIVDASVLIEKYQDRGLTTPQEMMRRWVGWNNQSWIRANNQVLGQIQTLGI